MKHFLDKIDKLTGKNIKRSYRETIDLHYLSMTEFSDFLFSLEVDNLPVQLTIEDLNDFETPFILQKQETANNGHQYVFFEKQAGQWFVCSKNKKKPAILFINTFLVIPSYLPTVALLQAWAAFFPLSLIFLSLYYHLLPLRFYLRDKLSDYL